MRGAAAMAWSLTAVATLLACGSTPAATSPVSASAPLVPRDQHLGWLGLIPSRGAHDHDPPYTMLDRRFQLALVGSPSGLPDVVEAIASKGGPLSYRASGVVKVPFGPDHNELEVTTFQGLKVRPGVAWVLPSPVPARWSPTAVRPTDRSLADHESHVTVGDYQLRYVVAGLAEQRDSGPAVLGVRAGRITAVHLPSGTSRLLATFEHKHIGVDPREPLLVPIDGPGVPEVAAAWKLAPTGPTLLCLVTRRHDRFELRAYLLDPAEHVVREIESMSAQLYVGAP